MGAEMGTGEHEGQKVRTIPKQRERNQPTGSAERTTVPQELHLKADGSAK